MIRFYQLFACLLVIACLALGPGAMGQTEDARNPVIWADVPDVAVIRVDDAYYMASTTMHMNPGLPIMKSNDLVNWDIVSYAYDRLTDNDAMSLENGQSAYGSGSWAPSLRYHDGTFYASTFSSTSGMTHIYTTDDPVSGEWTEHAFRPSLHDHSLFFEDGRVYLIYGVGDIRIRELNEDLSGIKEDGVDRILIHNASAPAGDNIGLHAEGSQLHKIDGVYYLLNITWPRGGMRTVLVHRADSLDGPWEGRVGLQDQGIAQGCLIDAPDGKWYAILFQDNGAVGRTPWVVPVTWEEGWPVFGIDGKAPATIDIPAGDQNISGVHGIVTSDEFKREAGDRPLPLAWQWNHNPVHEYWSLDARPGFLRITTSRVDDNVLQARNTLTQRTFGPESSARTAIDVSNMNSGDIAGLIALQRHYGYIGVKATEQGRSIVMVSVPENTVLEVEAARVPDYQEVVHLRIDCDFTDRTDKAYFYYSLDGMEWIRVGEPLQMRYTLPHFMGYRFGLFNYATEQTGGYVDFAHYRVDGRIEDESAREP